jgi:phosphohistidine phosphatase
MELYLLRHGRAVERGDPEFADDSARPLTPQGRRQLRQSCATLRKLKLKFDLILSSPLVRARQTAEIVAAELRCKKPPCFSENLRPGGDRIRLLAELKALGASAEKVLLVGHEPDLGGLICLLVTGKTGAGFPLKKGGLAKLEIGKLRAGQCAALAWLLAPKLMKAMR